MNVGTGRLKRCLNRFGWAKETAPGLWCALVGMAFVVFNLDPATTGEVHHLQRSEKARLSELQQLERILAQRAESRLQAATVERQPPGIQLEMSEIRKVVNRLDWKVSLIFGMVAGVFSVAFGAALGELLSR